MFDTLLSALQATDIPFAAYGWDHAPAGAYGVISLEGQEDSVAGDGRILTQSIRGSIDLFVKGTGTTEAEAIQGAINGLVAWRLNSVQFEDDTGLVHYEWVYESVGF